MTLCVVVVVLFVCLFVFVLFFIFYGGGRYHNSSKYFKTTFHTLVTNFEIKSVLNLIGDSRYIAFINHFKVL